MKNVGSQLIVVDFRRALNALKRRENAKTNFEFVSDDVEDDETCQQENVNRADTVEYNRKHASDIRCPSFRSDFTTGYQRRW